MPEAEHEPGVATSQRQAGQPDDSYRLVSLGAQRNCIGIEPRRRPGSGAFNIWSNTFPAEELPFDCLIWVGGVPFSFPAGDGRQPDNIRCLDQRIGVRPCGADWIFVLAAAERRTEDLVTIGYADGTSRAQWLRVSDFWPQTAPRFGELAAFRTSAMLYPNHVDERMKPAIWRQRIPVSVPGVITSLTVPDNPALHIFALTLAAEAVPAAEELVA